MRQRAVPSPQLEIAVHRALRRKILRQMAPRTAGLQHIKQPADHRADVDLARSAAAFGRRDQRRKDRPFAIRQIARISQRRSVIACSALFRPHVVPLALLRTTYRITTCSSDSTSFRTGSKRADILAEAREKMEALRNSIPAIATVIRHLIEIGIESHDIRSSASDPAVTMVRAEENNMLLPPVFDADGDIMLLSRRFPDREIWDPLHMYEFEAILNTWMQNFLPACR